MKFFSLRSFLTAVSCFAVFGLTACELNDDDDGGVNGDGGVKSDSGPADQDECKTEADCASKTCQTAACTEGKCSWTATPDCCSDSEECKSSDVCEVGACADNTCSFSKIDENVGKLGGCCSDASACSEGVCDTEKNVCVECLASTDCTGEKTVCDTEKNVCVECLSSDDCTGEKGVCDTENNVCVECLAATDCSQEINGCQTRVCNTDHTCGAEWPNKFCCVAHGTGDDRKVEGCTDMSSNPAKADAGYDCYNAADASLFNSSSSATKDGAVDPLTGVCALKSAVDACNTDCADSMYPFECVLTETGSETHKHVGYCTLSDEARPDVSVNAGEPYCGYTAQACNEATATNQRNVCDAAGESCAVANILTACTVTIADGGERTSGCDDANMDCYSLFGTLIEENGGTGLCAYKAAIEERCANCQGRDYCDGTSVKHTDNCTVDPEVAGDNRNRVVACGAAVEKEDCSANTEGLTSCQESETGAVCVAPSDGPKACTAATAATICEATEKCYGLWGEKPYVTDKEVTGDAEGVCFAAAPTMTCGTAAFCDGSVLVQEGLGFAIYEEGEPSESAEWICAFNPESTINCAEDGNTCIQEEGENAAHCSVNVGK